MKKLLCILFVSMLCPVHILGQGGKWTWMNGTNFSGGGAVYGTQGVPGASNTPAAIYECVYWQEKKGYLWAYAANSNLWKFDPYTNMWTWVSGPGNVSVSAVYGTKGVAAPGNQPGTRGNGTATWIDTQGNLWLFGGISSGMINDLWKYDISSNMWTWISGANFSGQSGVYGTQGVPSPLNVPGARYEVICSWTNNGNDLWFYGGYNGNFLNDLWKYDISTNEWTWMNGSSTPQQISVYGTMGVPAPANHPGARCAVGHWVDQSGNFWLLGGNGPDLNGVQHCFNDMWKYDPNTNLWTWMHGTQTGFDAGWYKSYCQPTSLTRPTPRYEHHACATDKCGNLWIYGGGTFVVNSSLSDKGDLCRFDINTNQWTWLSGDSTNNTAPVFGTQYVPSITNKPGSRNGAVALMDSLNNFWFFGGWRFNGGNYNTMWRFVTDSACAKTCQTLAPSAQFGSTQVSNCGAGCFSFSDSSLNAPTSWQWSFPGAQITTSSASNPSGICYASGGTYTVSLVVCNSNGCDTITKQISVNVIPQPVVTIGHDTSTCAGDTVLFTATSGYTNYQWYYNGTPVGSNANTLHATQAGSYVAVVSNGSGCNASDTVLLSVGSPTVNLPADTSLCTNQPLFVLNAGANFASYQWFQNGVAVASGASTYTATTSGSYVIHVADTIGCPASDSITIAFNPLPSVVAGTDTFLCNGASTILHASGASTYTWTPATFLNNVNSSSPQSSPSTTITYTVTGTDANNCTASDTVHITVSTPITVNVGNDTNICGATTIVLNAGANFTSYQWYQNGIMVAGSGSTYTVSATGSYAIHVTDTFGCAASDSVTIVLNPVPAVVAGPDTTLCNGSSAMLHANGASAYTWTPGTFLNNVNSPSPQTSPSTNITYTVTGTDANNCSASDTVRITVSTPLPVNLGNDTNICGTATMQLNAGTANSYQWYQNGTSMTVTAQTISVTQSGTYAVVTSNAFNCTASDSVTINFFSLPIVDAGQDTSLCLGASVSLNAGGATNYTWTPALYLNNSNNASPVCTPGSDITYTVIGSNAQGCVAQDTLRVNVLPVPNINLGADTNVCMPNSVVLNAGAGNQYQWYYSGVLLSVNTQTLSVNQQGYYVAYVTNAQGCSAVDSLFLAVNGLPLIQTSADTFLCGSQSLVLNASGATTYSWSPSLYLNATNVSSPTATPASSITYTVTGTDVNGCSSSDSVSITMYPQPVADFSVQLTYSCDGIEARMNNFSTNANTSYWNFGDGSVSTATEPVHIYANLINATILLVTSNGPCSDTASVSGLSMSSPDHNTLPNIFTPNDDGINDCFALSTGVLANCYSIVIFNRWGTKVFESSGGCWNGQLFNTGEKLPDGVYYFIAEFGRSKIAGVVHLLR